MELLDIVKDITLSFFVAFGFALLFEAPRKAVWIAAILGGLGHGIRYTMILMSFDLVIATLCGCVFIGLISIPFAHKIHTPPIVFTLPACITMIPGLYAYRTMLSCIKVYENGESGSADMVQQAAYNFTLTASLLFCLAIGICIAALIFRKNSIKKVKKIKDLYMNFF